MKEKRVINVATFYKTRNHHDPKEITVQDYPKVNTIPHASHTPGWAWRHLKLLVWSVRINVNQLQGYKLPTWLHLTELAILWFDEQKSLLCF